jgi:hypothetical protein
MAAQATSRIRTCIVQACGDIERVDDEGGGHEGLGLDVPTLKNLEDQITQSIRRVLHTFICCTAMGCIYCYKPHEKTTRHQAQTQLAAADQHSPLTTLRHTKRGTANKKHRQTPYYATYHKECNTDLLRAGTSQATRSSVGTCNPARKLDPCALASTPTLPQ